MTQTYDIPRVVIEVRGGVAYLTQKDSGIIVEIDDYDTDNDSPEVRVYDVDFECHQA